MNRLDWLVDRYEIEKDKPTIFLSGAMTGLSEDEQKGWRDTLKMRFEDKYIFFDPTIFDAEDTSDKAQQIAHDYDIESIAQCDYFIVNLNKVETSVGTCQEIMLAWLLSKKIIGFFPTGNLVKPLHPWIKNKLTFKMHNMKALSTFLELTYYEEIIRKL